ncbi:ATP-binding protein [Ferruginibacter profundus]
MKKYFLFLLVLLSHKGFSQKHGQAFVDSVTAMLPLAANDTVRARMYKALSDECFATLPGKALEYTRAGLALSRQMNWIKGIAAFNLNMGRNYQAIYANTDSAIYYYKLSYDLFEKNNFKAQANTVLNNMGVVYQGAGNYTKAIEYFTYVLKNAEAFKDSTIMISSFANIALVYFQHSNYLKSLENWKKCLLLQQKTNINTSLANAYTGMGLCYSKLKDSSNAALYLNKGIATAIKNNDSRFLGAAYSSAAEIEKNIPAAIAMRKKAQGLLEKYSAGDVTAISNLTSLGQLYFSIVKDNRFAETAADKTIPKDTAAILALAKSFYNEALQTSNKLKNKAHIAEINGYISELDNYNNDFKNAYLHLKSYKELNDSIFSQENKNKIAEAESKYEIAKKNEELAIKQLTITTQKNRMWLLATGIGFLIILGAVLYRQGLARKKTNTTLLQLNSELDEANKVKAKFFGILSHDLRSPVANLINFLQLQKRNPGILNEQDIAARENKIATSASALLETMEGMLLWSKGQMDNFKPEITAVPVSNLFTYLQKFFSGTENIRFSFDDPDSIIVYTDENYLRTIMQNLTANAIKALQHTPNAAIEWKVKKENGKVILSVTDNGPGISNEKAKTLFDETSVSGSRHGLGLHIVKDLAKAIGCNINLQSASNGTSFLISL